MSYYTSNSYIQLNYKNYLYYKHNNFLYNLNIHFGKPDMEINMKIMDLLANNWGLENTILCKFLLNLVILYILGHIIHSNYYQYNIDNFEHCIHTGFDLVITHTDLPLRKSLDYIVYKLSDSMMKTLTD